MNKKDVSFLVQTIAHAKTPYKVLSSVRDDKTFVCLYNTDMPPRPRNINYYREPNWKSLSEAGNGDKANREVPVYRPSFTKGPITLTTLPDVPSCKPAKYKPAIHLIPNKYTRIKRRRK